MMMMMMTLMMTLIGEVSSDVALVYNDRSVLENFHVSAVFRLLRDDDYNVLSSLKTDEYRSATALYVPLWAFLSSKLIV